MPRHVDLLLANALPLGESAVRDLAIAAGRFVVAEPGMTADRVIDVGGRLTIPGFVEPHIHLDKALIVDSVRPNVSGTLTEAIEIIWERKRDYTIEDIDERAGHG